VVLGKGLRYNFVWSGNALSKTQKEPVGCWKTADVIHGIVLTNQTHVSGGSGVTFFFWLSVFSSKHITNIFFIILIVNLFISFAS
jgi:hypothetical protein